MIKVGCCGYPTAMKRYFDHFDLVEINSTFYRLPRMQTVMNWRERAPWNFEFTVKAHRDLSHRYRFELEPSLEAFDRMRQICEALRSRVVLIQTPGSFRADQLEKAVTFFRKVESGKLTLVWETRGPSWEDPDMRAALAEAMRELNVSHVVDPFKSTPAHSGRVAYFRLHGLGRRLYYHEYSNDELQQLRQMTRPFEEDERMVYVLFNNLTMFQDGSRFIHFMKTNRFPKLSKTAGLDSVRNLLERARFPATKGELSRRVGWRLVELESGHQIRMDEFLKELPTRSFKNAKEVLHEIGGAGLL